MLGQFDEVWELVWATDLRRKFGVMSEGDGAEFGDAGPFLVSPVDLRDGFENRPKELIVAVSQLGGHAPYNLHVAIAIAPAASVDDRYWPSNVVDVNLRHFPALFFSLTPGPSPFSARLRHAGNWSFVPDQYFRGPATQTSNAAHTGAATISALTIKLDRPRG